MAQASSACTSAPASECTLAWTSESSSDTESAPSSAGTTALRSALPSENTSEPSSVGTYRTSLALLQTQKTKSLRFLVSKQRSLFCEDATNAALSSGSATAAKGEGHRQSTHIGTAAATPQRRAATSPRTTPSRPTIVTCSRFRGGLWRATLQFFEVRRCGKCHRIAVVEKDQKPTETRQGASRQRALWWNSRNPTSRLSAPVSLRKRTRQHFLWTTRRESSGVVREPGLSAAESDVWWRTRFSVLTCVPLRHSEACLPVKMPAPWPSLILGSME